jgi:hypothetical protein
MSWMNAEFLEARRTLLQCDDFRAQRALGHELDDGTMDTPLGSDVPFRVRFQCRFCGSTIRFVNAAWSEDGSAKWRLFKLPGDTAAESCRERRERHRSVRMA